MKNYQTIKKAKLIEISKDICDSWRKEILNLVLEQDGSNIEVPNDLIKRAYNEANAKQKKFIEDHFEIINSNFKKIKDYPDVCDALGIDELNENDFKFLPKEQRKKQLALHKLQNIETLLNDGWVKDWKNQSQYKYYPYFAVSSDGGLVFDSCGSYSSCFGDAVGLFKDKETAEFVGKTFKDIYKDLM